MASATAGKLAGLGKPKKKMKKKKKKVGGGKAAERHRGGSQEGRSNKRVAGEQRCGIDMFQDHGGS